MKVVWDNTGGSFFPFLSAPLIQKGTPLALVIGCNYI